MTDQEYRSRIRYEYAQTLKEIVKHENEITHLKEKAKQLEDKMATFGDTYAPPPHLDRDGCVYWDSVLVKGEEDD